MSQLLNFSPVNKFTPKQLFDIKARLKFGTVSLILDIKIPPLNLDMLLINDLEFFDLSSVLHGPYYDIELQKYHKQLLREWWDFLENQCLLWYCP